MSRLQVHAVCLPPDDTYPFHITAKRYRPSPATSTNSSPGALTLLFLHSTSFHKEIYEPVIDTLFARCAAAGAPRVREAWAVDCPNHGASAALNAALLLRAPYDEYFSCARYAEAVARFLAAHVPAARLVCVGHSLGGCAAILLSAKVPLASLVLVDPFLYPDGDPAAFAAMRARLVAGAHERRDVWASRAEAAASLERRGRWDARVLALYVEHGLRAHPHAARAVAPYGGVTLACTREQEATMYRDASGAFAPLAPLAAACARMPVHAAFGAVPTVIPRAVQENTADRRVRAFASLAWLPGVGHLVPQEAPDALAAFVFDALVRDEQARARL